MITVEDLKADPRTIEAEARLKKAGMTDARWLGLLNLIVALPARHAQITLETKADARKRREELAKKMSILAKDIKGDWEASEIYPLYGGAKGLQPILRIGRPHEGALSLAGWLNECGDHLKSGSPNDDAFMPFENRHGTVLRAFVIRGVAQELVTNNRAKNVEAALLASSVLNEKVSANDVCQARRQVRRRYYKE